MARNAWLRVASAGFFAASLAFLFVGGCYVDVGSTVGKCEDDNNPCTKDTCDAAGKPSHVAVDDAAKIQCFLGENEGVCTAGMCELLCKTQMTACKCNSKTDCPMDNFCGTWACTMGECVNTPDTNKEGMTADPLDPGDCQRKICQGGALKQADDPMDTPTDTKGDCQDPICNAGVPGTMANDNDVPVVDMIPGDCKKPSCNGGMLVAAPDTMDPPASDECTTYSCSPEGESTPANAKIGTPCGPNDTLACDKLGMCVGCLEKPDWDKCNMPAGSCLVPKCDGEPCTNKDECKTACVDGVCCNTTCTEECKSCKVAGSEGICTNIPFYDEDPKYTDSQTMNPNSTCKKMDLHACNGMGECLTLVKQPCSLNTDCMGGVCFDVSAGTDYCLGAPGEPCSGNADFCVSKTCENGLCK